MSLALGRRIHMPFHPSRAQLLGYHSQKPRGLIPLNRAHRRPHWSQRDSGGCARPRRRPTTHKTPQKSTPPHLELRRLDSRAARRTTRRLEVPMGNQMATPDRLAFSTWRRRSRVEARGWRRGVEAGTGRQQSSSRAERKEATACLHALFGCVAGFQARAWLGHGSAAGRPAAAGAPALPPPSVRNPAQSTARQGAHHPPAR